MDKKAYATKHEYDYYCFYDLLDNKIGSTWNKVLAIQKILNTNLYDWIFWMDADTIIIKKSIKLEDYLDDKYDFIAVRDCKCCSCLNTGCFFIKNTEFSKNLLVVRFLDSPKIKMKKI